MLRSFSDAPLASPLPPAAAAADPPSAAVNESAVVADVVQQAHAARMSGDWTSARALYEQAAPLDSKGEAEAWLSISCLTGLGCDKDADQAHQFAVASAEKGFAFGVNNLGHCLEHGIGCAKDAAQAVLMYEKAAAAGEPLAMNNLGLCLQAGTGVEKNEERAAQLFERSARMGSSHGLNSLGNCYFQGRGVQQNYEQAFVLYERASQNRNVNKSAIYNLGCCFYSGKGTPQDANEAFFQFQRAADLGLDIAQYVAPSPLHVFVTVCFRYRLAVCLRDGIGCERNVALALDSFRAAAAQGMAKANVAVLDLMMADMMDGGDGSSAPNLPVRQQQLLSPGAVAGAGSDSALHLSSPLAHAAPNNGFQVVAASPVTSSLQLQGEQEPPMEHSRPATPDSSISHMHLFQLQQQFAEHLRELRLRHEREVRQLHEHFEPLIATAGSLASAGTPRADNMYCMLPPQQQQAVEAAPAAVHSLSQHTLAPADAFSPSFNRIPPPPISATSSPAADAPLHLNPSPSPSAFIPPSSSNVAPDAAPSLSPFSGAGISSSYRRSVVVRHMQNKLL